MNAYGWLVDAMAADTDDWSVAMEERAAREERPRLPLSPSDEPWYDDARIAAWEAEDVSDAPTVTGGMRHEAIREDGWMWDALVGGGAA